MTSEELTAQMCLIGENPLSGLDEFAQTTFIPDLDLTSLNDSIQPVDDFILNFIQQEQSIINQSFIDSKNDFNFDAAIEPVSAPMLSDETSFLNVIESLNQIVHSTTDSMDNLLDFNLDFLTNNNSMDVIGSPSRELTFADLNELVNDTVTPKKVTSEATDQTSQSGSFSDDENSQYSLSIMSPVNSSSNESNVSNEKVKRVRGSRVDKRESNKAAATKYRYKKLKEREDLFAECDEFAKKNADLKSKIDDIQTEISFIKSLLVEALISKTKKNSK